MKGYKLPADGLLVIDGECSHYFQNSGQSHLGCCVNGAKKGYAYLEFVEQRVKNGNYIQHNTEDIFSASFEQVVNKFKPNAWDVAVEYIDGNNTHLKLTHKISGLSFSVEENFPYNRMVLYTSSFPLADGVEDHLFLFHFALELLNVQNSKRKTLDEKNWREALL